MTTLNKRAAADILAPQPISPSGKCYRGLISKEIGRYWRASPLSGHTPAGMERELPYLAKGFIFNGPWPVCNGVSAEPSLHQPASGLQRDAMSGSAGRPEFRPAATPWRSR